MQRLADPQAANDWLRARVQGQLTVDSRRVGAHDGFVAWPGAAVDGRQFVGDALAQGAAACLVEAQGVEHALPDALRHGTQAERIASYDHLKADTGPIASLFYGEPTRQLATVAVTGTNGKTSTAWWLASLLPHLPAPHAQRCLMVGTLGVGEPPAVHSTGLTTPDPVRLHQAFRDAVQDGVTACVMEASSIGLAEHRLDGVRIDTAVFTNFTQDHLDYHADMADYWQAKRRLFDWPGLRHAVVNIDDDQGARLAEDLKTSAQAGELDLWTVGRHPAARLRAVAVHHADEGMGIELSDPDDERVVVHTTQFGDFNVNNLLGVIACMRAWGVPLAAVAQGVARLPAVPGRLQRVAAAGRSGPLVLVDYAHTPDALDKALQAVRPLADQRGGRLWCVFGCGGNRDAAKRPLMGRVAEQGADRVVVTSDNPRHEAPMAIIEAIQAGMTRPHLTEVDRGGAIQMAITQASPRDVVVLAGKGHEDYQEVVGERHPFSDLDVARLALQRRSSGGAP
ncbi:UDP-N-acetylmuramoyl-L-alanyl-D-glutamate--2,6-diaminopimelate ligase [Comamonas serinivorans]|uniref:UDP-N-acetylmuramoyl-L-alanyl-D-glutamate--2,6-diaminopimelate ligase n=1 Tax=Comamonas serinivorans TaxID=1082851 RepID=A0A1Y0EU27_9BURK|nr:UDP-N-acetylmuramoyl-L-alanyl-D-glutamate--2,6-diaminopimelate ligase [Comamonas serinivorans]